MVFESMKTGPSYQKIHQFEHQELCKTLVQIPGFKCLQQKVISPQSSAFFSDPITK